MPQNNKGYQEEDYLLLSGLQHFSFCRRQWALIHIEQQWQENLRTVEGMLLHQRAHDDRIQEKRGGLLISRGMPVYSRELGVSGVCDVVEFRQSADGIPLFGRPGLYQPTPIEYKRGSPKESDADRLQLCCQAMCLEEMLSCPISQGCLYYGETKRRSPVEFTEPLREQVVTMLEEMHRYFARGYTPKVKPSKSCKACSLADLCLPKLYRSSSAEVYVKKHLMEEDS
ncbi:MAG: CRISPR-associated protein Cas4 [Peptococcaceae bacterium]|nr:CRISPR-associated protein Cas4 [Peptococcaceae bacterium]